MIRYLVCFTVLAAMASTALAQSVSIKGAGIDLTADFGTSFAGENGETVRPVSVTGIVDGKEVLQIGTAHVDDRDRVCIAGSGEDSCVIRWTSGHPGELSTTYYRLYLTIPASEFEEEGEDWDDDNLCGSMETSTDGVLSGGPNDRRCVKS